MAMNVERPIERIAIDLIKDIDINFMVLFNYSVNLSYLIAFGFKLF